MTALTLSADETWLLACAGAAVCRIETTEAQRWAERLARLGLVETQPLNRQTADCGVLSVIEITPAGRDILART